MKQQYRLFKRGEYFYAENNKTGKQESLRTSDRQEAQRLIVAKNEAANTGELTLAVGKAYLSAIDPVLFTRTWANVMTLMQQRGGESTQDRTTRALKCKAFDVIRAKPVMETSAADFLSVLSDGTSSTNHYLKLLHALALDLGWLIAGPVLSKASWPKVRSETKRAITWEEHLRIASTEQSTERKHFYEALWETGASQTDAAMFSTANVNWQENVLVYHRQKTGEKATISIGTRLQEILKTLPVEGPFFPTVSTWDSVRRAAEFYRRCKILGIVGISLHSYRYAWAERAYRLGYPERFAQAALGHSSRAVHHAYARGASVNCPALDDYARNTVAHNTVST
jgi:integrase